MHILRSIDEFAQLAPVPGQPLRSVVTIGNFDGIHLAHRQLLSTVAADARALGARSLAFTFEPHPLRILHPDRAPKLITPLEEKIRQFASTEIEALLLLPFDRDLSLLTPREFVERVLVDGLHVAAIHEGSNFCFGHRQQGTMEVLRELGREFGFAVREHSEMRLRGQLVSSSRIRELIAAGRVEAAARLLGRPFSLHGLVGQGHGIGHRLTVPTLNLQHYEELLPGFGVYVTQTRAGGRLFDSVTNVGIRPTFMNAGGVSVETHLLDFQEVDIDDLEIRFLMRLRPERKFASPAALKSQILTDVARARRYFRHARPLLPA